MSEFKNPNGVYFISEWNGNSLNSGDDENPFAHFADVPLNDPGSGFALYYVIGPGMYQGNSGKAYTALIGDSEHRGSVIVDLQDSISTEKFRHLSNVYLKNSEGLVALQDYRYGLFNNNIIENCKSFYASWTPPLGNANRNLVTGTKTIIGSGGNAYLYFFYSTINQPFSPTFTWRNFQGLLFLEKTSEILSFVTSANSSNFINNRINNPIKINGDANTYELKFYSDGTTRTDANPAYLDLASKSGFSNIYSALNNFAYRDADLKIIDLYNLICEPDSDLVKGSDGSSFIGGFRVGRAIKKGDSDADLTITTSQIDTSNPSNWTIGAGYDEGYIFITFKLSDNLVQVPKIHMDGLLAFDSSESGGSVGNNNVPDFFPTLYTPLSQSGLKPNRLTYGLRTSQRIAKPTSESHWDNDNLALGSDVARYYVQEWGDQPKIYDVLGVTYGGGNAESVGASGNAINARWCQIQIRLTNRREQ